MDIAAAKSGRMGSDMRALALIFLALVLPQSLRASEAWEASTDVGPAGQFRPPRPLTASYAFGWNGFTAATADVSFGKAGEANFELKGNGHTIGLARTLWKFDVDYRSLTSATTLRPVQSRESETVRSKNIVTELAFDGNGVTRKRIERPTDKPAKARRFAARDLFDLQSALLYLRSQPLRENDVHRLVVYPATSAYLATVTVARRETVSVPAGKFNAIKLDLDLSKISKDRKLEPHRKFRSASAWISDDSDRTILRIEAQIFIGSVFAELQSVRFEDVKS